MFTAMSPELTIEIVTNIAQQMIELLSCDSI